MTTNPVPYTLNIGNHSLTMHSQSISGSSNGLMSGSVTLGPVPHEPETYPNLITLPVDDTGYEARLLVSQKSVQRIVDVIHGLPTGFHRRVRRARLPRLLSADHAELVYSDYYVKREYVLLSFSDAAAAVEFRLKFAKELEDNE